jgi:uracil phosphoribosyltransferase
MPATHPGQRAEKIIPDTNIEILDHPVVSDALTTIRDKTCQPDQFRQSIDIISRILAMRATDRLPFESVPIDTPLETMTGRRQTSDPVTLVPIVRAGLGMVDGFLDIIPDARIGHVGVYRDSDTHEPVEYLNRLPSDIGQGPVFILDPMVATGGSGAYVTKLILNQAGIRPDQVTFCAIVSVQTGVDRIKQVDDGIRMITAAMDRGLDDNDYIRPGLGDAGDRLFGTDH